MFRPSPSFRTCAGRPGSEGFEALDAQTFASWGIDYVKEDSCSAPTDPEKAFDQYATMRDALNAVSSLLVVVCDGLSCELPRRLIQAASRTRRDLLQVRT